MMEQLQPRLTDTMKPNSLLHLGPACHPAAWVDAPVVVGQTRNRTVETEQKTQASRGETREFAV